MKSTTKKAKKIKSIRYRYIIYSVILICLLQFWALKTFYKEREIKLPENLFTAQKEFPISELTLDISYDQSGSASSENIGEQVSTKEDNINKKELNQDQIIDDSSNYSDETSETQDEKYTSEIEGINLSEVQKKIVLRSLELLDENIEYGYRTYPETGYPDTENIYISTDIISVVLRDSGYNLMELIYEDMLEHKDDYPMDLTGRKDPIKYIDFRNVFFQEQFFKRHALGELPTKYTPEDENNNILWQPGDIVYFQFDEENPYKDLGGLISPHKNDNGVPLVIMISKEFGKVKEVDVLLEYKIIGHYRYPPPEVEE